MGIRLNKILSEFNIGINTVIEFLKENHIGEIRDDANPNTKITDAQYRVLLEKFGSNKSQSELVNNVSTEIASEDKDEFIKNDNECDILKKIQNSQPFFLRSEDDVNKLFTELKANNINLNSRIDLAIRLAIQKVKLQVYYVSKRNEYNKQRQEFIPTIITHSKAVNGSVKTKKQIRAEERQKKVEKLMVKCNSIGTNIETYLSQLFYTTQTIDNIIEYLKQHRKEYDAVTEKWIRKSISGVELLDYYKERMHAAFTNYGNVEKQLLNIEANVNDDDIQIQIKAFRKKLLSFLDQRRKVKTTVTVKKVKEKKEPTFDSLKQKEWILDWNCVILKRGSVVIFSRSDLGFSFKPREFPARHSIESFNYLKKYMNERLPPVRCIISGQTIKIMDAINFSKAIQQFEEASKQSAIKIGRSLSKYSSPSPMTFSQALSKAHKMKPEEFKKYKSKYIDYLVDLQSKAYKVIPCVERLAHMNSDNTEYAFMFSIECSSGRILIVHENVNPDRSTLLFFVKKEDYNRSIREIYDFLQSAEVNKRSSLRDRSLEIKNAGIVSYRSINHDDLYSWKQTISIYKKYR